MRSVVDEQFSVTLPWVTLAVFRPAVGPAVLDVPMIWASSEAQHGGDFLSGAARFTDGRALHVRALDVATPAKGDQFEIAGAFWEVVERPRHPQDDPEGLIWAISVNPAVSV